MVLFISKIGITVRHGKGENNLSDKNGVPLWN